MSKNDPQKAKNPSKVALASSGRKVTIYDIAKMTGFSPGTVSRVLNNKDRVKMETRQKVLETARELGLKPQVSVRTKQIAILTEPTFTDRIEGYAATLASHLAFEFSKRNIGVTIPTDPIRQLSDLFLDGIVAVTYDTELQEYLEQLEGATPVVYMDRFGDAGNCYRVCSDHYNAGFLAAEHFIKYSKKKLAFFGGQGDAFEERKKGFVDAMKVGGIECDEGMIVSASQNEHQAVITRLVRRGADAIYVPGSSFQVLECLHLLTYVMGKRVPEDVAVIGGENEGISQYQNPPLTTIEEPLTSMAESAVMMIERLTSGQKVKESAVTLPVRLIERNSVI